MSIATKSLPFPAIEYMDRLKKARDAMRKEGIELLILNAPENIHYLTGYHTKGVFAYQFLAVPYDGPLAFMTRRIEVGSLMIAIDAGSLIADHAFYDDNSDPIPVLLNLVERNGFPRARVGVEKRSWYLSVDHYERLMEAWPKADFVDASTLIDQLRLIKSPMEVSYHRRAGAIAVKGMKAAMGAIAGHAPDGGVVSATIGALIEAGGEWMATWPNVRCGERTGIAHGTWQNTPIRAGDIASVELAGVFMRYHTPLHRTALLAPTTTEQREFAGAVREANAAGLQAIRPGVTAGEVYRAIRSVIVDRGYEDVPEWRLGYTVGIGFPPTWAHHLGVDITRNSPVVLEAGMVFHMHTWIRYKQMFSMGQSSTIVVTGDGYENLTADMEAGPLFID
jgi:Xaa-Pro dipeptidase